MTETENSKGTKENSEIKNKLVDLLFKQCTDIRFIDKNGKPMYIDLKQCEDLNTPNIVHCKNSLKSILRSKSSMENVYSALVRLLRFRSKLHVSGTCTLQITYENLYKRFKNLNVKHPKTISNYKSGVLIINTTYLDPELSPSYVALPDNLVNTGLILLNIEELQTILSRCSKDTHQVTNINLGNFPMNYWADMESDKFITPGSYKYTEFNSSAVFGILKDFNRLLNGVCCGTIKSIYNWEIDDILNMYNNILPKWLAFNEARSKDTVVDTWKNSDPIHKASELIYTRLAFLSVIIRIILYTLMYKSFIKEYGKLENDADRKIFEQAVTDCIHQTRFIRRFADTATDSYKGTFIIGSMSIDSVVTDSKLVTSRQKQLDNKLTKLINTIYSPDTIKFVKTQKSQKFKISNDKNAEITKVITDIKDFIAHDRQYL
jgi:hypothetical protein